MRWMTTPPLTTVMEMNKDVSQISEDDVKTFTTLEIDVAKSYRMPTTTSMDKSTWRNWYRMWRTCCHGKYEREQYFDDYYLKLQRCSFKDIYTRNG